MFRIFIFILLFCTPKNYVADGKFKEIKVREDIKENRIKNSFLDSSFNYFTFFAIFVSCLGLFGLASFTAEQTTKEIAVRKVLGASIVKIVGRLSKEFLILVGIANLFAWPIAYVLMGNWIQSYSYHTKIQIWMFLGAGIIALIIALLTVSYQSIKTASKNPMDSLKYE